MTELYDQDAEAPQAPRGNWLDLTGNHTGTGPQHRGNAVGCCRPGLVLVVGGDSRKTPQAETR